jgi:hypothetical protein
MGEPTACTCSETHVRSKRLAFLKVDTSADQVAAEAIASGIKDVARGLWVLHDYLVSEDEPDAAGLVVVLRDRLQCEVEALDVLLDMEVMVEVTGAEEPAGEPNLSLRLAPEPGG